jgi:hypothetical protein
MYLDRAVKIEFENIYLDHLHFDQNLDDVQNDDRRAKKSLKHDDCFCSCCLTSKCSERMKRLSRWFRKRSFDSLLYFVNETFDERAMSTTWKTKKLESWNSYHSEEKLTHQRILFERHEALRHSHDTHRLLNSRNEMMLSIWHLTTFTYHQMNQMTTSSDVTREFWLPGMDFWS